MATSLVAFQFSSVVLSNLLSQYRTSPYYDPSGVNVLGIKHFITGRGTLAKGLPPAQSGESASDILARLKTSLMRSRRFVMFAPYGTVIVTAGDPNDPENPDVNLDIAGGPKCTDFRVVSVAEACIEVEIDVEVTTLACTDDNDRAVLSHRFKQSEDYDAMGYATATTHGVIMLRADKVLLPNARGKLKTMQEIFDEAGMLGTRDGFQLVPPITHGFSEDALTLSYVRTDKEFEVRPPDEAPVCDVEFFTYSPPGNVATWATVAVSLKGAKGVAKDKLFVRATRIAASMLRFFRPVDAENKSPAVHSIRIKNPAMENAVELQITILADQKKLFTKDGDFRAELMGVLPAGTSRRGTRDGEKPYVPPLTEFQRTDVLRPRYGEPCEDLVAQVTPTKTGRANSQLAGVLRGEFTPTDGGTAGGGGIPVVGGIFTQEQADAILSGNGAAVGAAFGFASPAADPFGSLIPLQDREPSLMDQFAPPGGVGGEPGSPDFANLGGNTVDNRATRAASDPIDSTLPYSAYELSMTLRADTGLRMSRGCGPVGKDGRPQPNPVCSVGNPMCEVVVSWSAIRQGRPPQIPSPFPPDDANGRNYMLQTIDLTIDKRSTSADGQSVRYHRAGAYTYWLRQVDQAKLFELVPPQLLIETKAAFPGDMDSENSAMSREIIWLGLGKVSPSPIFAGLFATPSGVPVPPAPLPVAPPAFPGTIGVEGLLGDAEAGGDQPYSPNPGG